MGVLLGSVLICHLSLSPGFLRFQFFSLSFPSSHSGLFFLSLYGRYLPFAQYKTKKTEQKKTDKADDVFCALIVREAMGGESHMRLED